MKTLRLWAISLLMLGLSLQLSAQVPNPPTDFNAAFTQISGTTFFNVTLNWRGSSSDDTNKRAVGYYIYMADSATEDVSQFRMIATVTTPIQSNYFQYIVEHLSAGTYTFFVRAFNNNGISDRTSIKVLKLVVSNGGGGGGGDVTLKFSTTPGTSVALGATYHYSARAYLSNQDSNKSSHIRYKIISGPDGMTIDSLTGNITWTAPNTTKTVEVKILAYLDNDDSKKADQSWTIRVGGDNNNGGRDSICAVLHGTVHDTSNQAVSGTVKAYLISSGGQIGSGYYQATIQNGQFWINVPAGTYVLRTQGENFEYEYYEHAKEPAQAHQFVVSCHDTVEANFRVTPLAQEVKYVFSGRLTDASTGLGIAGTVYFYRVVNNAVSGDPVTVRSNAEGYYEVQLSNRYTYLAKAVGNSDDYLPLYFEDAGTPAMATLLTPTGNRTNVNFALSMRQQFNNGLSGQLVDSAGTGVPGRVSAYLMSTDTANRDMQRYRTVETDANGNYSISSLYPGQYLLLGIPNSRPFVPGYYKENEYAVYQWVNATRITVGTSVITTPFTIKLRAGEGRRGIIQLKGIITGRGGYTKHTNDKQASVLLSGALVVVCDNLGKPVDYAFSGIDGSYQINELALGTNVIYADKPGFAASNQTIVFNSTSFIVDDNIQLDALISSVAEEAVTNGSVAPNPTSDLLTLRCESNGGLSFVQVFNSMGQEMNSRVELLTSGQNTLNLSTSNFSEGSYLLRITTGSAVSTFKFNVVR